jgi:predicted GNAT family acetyltransferase
VKYALRGWGIAGRLIESQLLGVRPMDTATIAGEAVLVALVVSPMESLRSE